MHSSTRMVSSINKFNHSTNLLNIQSQIVSRSTNQILLKSIDNIFLGKGTQIKNQFAIRQFLDRFTLNLNPLSKMKELDNFTHIILIKLELET